MPDHSTVYLQPHQSHKHQNYVDTTPTPPATQYGATRDKAGIRNRLRYAGFATLGNSLQRLKYHS
jgi:hypothetical protein